MHLNPKQCTISLYQGFQSQVSVSDIRPPRPATQANVDFFFYLPPFTGFILHVLFNSRYELCPLSWAQRMQADSLSDRKPQHHVLAG